ncbi:hypothetical protein HWC36_gp44 [Corynebacterium phage StAB]|uniref:Uncharacterized protein n=1 Tax=Corynebacterium phage StAB TaxID=2591204 RepID=A0A514DJJ0_9CAUD|nr:hypothetical protein HWC36_gp44 [Corynebacterium phage StAB]QDH93755.1 hypothetical protein SEA_STAB_44 [Corynebacterium phage StAB]
MKSANVTTMTATVRILQVGNRQLTKAMARQLDRVQWGELEPFGRIANWEYDESRPYVRVIGRRIADGELVTAVVAGPPRYEYAPGAISSEGDPEYATAKAIPLIILGGLR